MLYSLLRNRLGSNMLYSLLRNRLGSNMLYSLLRNTLGSNMLYSLLRNRLGSNMLYSLLRNTLGSNMLYSLLRNRLGSNMLYSLLRNRVSLLRKRSGIYHIALLYSKRIRRHSRGFHRNIVMILRDLLRLMVSHVMLLCCLGYYMNTHMCTIT